jgi:hypothetical protein
MIMRNATIELASDGTGLLCRLLESDTHAYAGMLEFRRVKIDEAELRPLTTPENVASYGAALMNALSAHSAVQKEIESMCDGVDGFNLQFVIAASESEKYRWETLYRLEQAAAGKPAASAPPAPAAREVSTNSFLALKAAALDRIAQSGDVKRAGPRIYAEPIRLAALLSPSQVECEREFAVLSQAVGAARGAGLQLEATAYIGELDLIERAKADIDAGRLPGIQVETIPDSAIGIEAALRAKPPQILHCFCHGSAQAGLQILEFASANDHDSNAVSGSVMLSVERLNELLTTMDSVWLTVLNCCSGAKAPPSLFSMAAVLARSASPLTIGMAEPIHLDDATRFTEAFYHEALAAMTTATKGLQVGSTSTIHLGAAVKAARAVLHATAQQQDEDPANFGRWSLPILYQRSAPLVVARVADEDMRERIYMVAKFLRTLPPSADDKARATFLTLLDNPPVPPALRPDRFGEFH